MRHIATVNIRPNFLHTHTLIEQRLRKLTQSR